MLYLTCHMFNLHTNNSQYLTRLGRTQRQNMVPLLGYRVSRKYLLTFLGYEKRNDDRLG
jgi:hypothetical protein